MLPTTTIIFREVLEICLILGIILAATQGLKNRMFYILSGLGLGFIGAAIIAFFTERISQAIDGMGQEIFNAIIMFIAVGFLIWTVIFMRTHGRIIAAKIKETGQNVIDGKKSALAISAVIALATFREGAEMALFVYSMATSGSFTITQIISGAIIGALGGLAIGFMLYAGIMRAGAKYVFSITSWLLIFLAAGMAAQGAHFLIAAGVLPALSAQLWDTSHILSASGFLGTALNVLIGYTPNPTGMEFLFYAVTLGAIVAMYKLPVKSKKKSA